MNNKQILENLFEDDSVSNEDKKLIAEILTVINYGNTNGILEAKVMDIIRKYRPEYYDS